MLTDKERQHVEQFFEDFPSEDLFALALIISKRNLCPTSRIDALNIICQHSERIESVLEKKKITKSYICQYLHKSKVSITFSWDKPALIRKLLEFWNVKSCQLHEFTGKEEVPSTRLNNQNTENIVSESTHSANSASEYFRQLSYKFAEWFYSLINDQDSSKIGPEHFFVDSQIKLALKDEQNTDIVEASNSIDISQTLREFQLKYRLQFLPNLTPGAVRYECDIHGQVMLMVNGTLHSNTSQVVGVFEQIFLLVRDISDHENWKIKKSHVILRSMNSAIQDSSLSEKPLPL